MAGRGGLCVPFLGAASGNEVCRGIDSNWLVPGLLIDDSVGHPLWLQLLSLYVLPHRQDRALYLGTIGQITHRDKANSNATCLSLTELAEARSFYSLAVISTDLIYTQWKFGKGFTIVFVNHNGIFIAKPNIFFRACILHSTDQDLIFPVHMFRVGPIWERPVV